MQSLLLSHSLARDARMHYSEGPFRFLDDANAISVSDQLGDDVTIGRCSACYTMEASPIAL